VREEGALPNRWHLLGLEGKSRGELLSIVESAVGFREILERDIKKVPALRGKTIVNLFLEASTRTRTSFEIAGKILSADTINIGANDSSASKGETVLDTAAVLESMNPDVIVVRHSASGVPGMLAKLLKRSAIVNAGDGLHEHPSQGLLDLVTIREAFGKITGLRIAIVGDVRHSRVARSNAFAHLTLGNEVRFVGPSTLVPKDLGRAFGQEVPVFHSLQAGVADCDVVMCLRMQLERMDEHFVPHLEEYSREFGVSERLLAKVAPRAKVMHPGPANRGIEVSSEVLDGPRSLFHTQVKNGVATRMAILFHAINGLAATVRERQ
jgi:aspartate carbamoyltransferase catalytic subunit